MSENDEEPSESKIIGPLNFSAESTTPKEPAASVPKQPIDIGCLFCDEVFQFYAKKDDYLAHLYLKHRLIIADEEQVAIFHEYLIYWQKMFEKDENKLAEYCTTMLMDQLPDGTPAKGEKYYLLCDILPQDNELRRNLYTKRMEQALAQHQFERVDDQFERNCLFCRDVIKSTRANFLEHLFSKHFLQLGKPENLVFIDELIDVIQDKLNNLICLFCEKEFRDRPTLKEHMRKKGHKRINPDNKFYDRFFLVNYRNEKQSSYGQRAKQKIKHRPRTKSQTQKSDSEKSNKATKKVEDGNVVEKPLAENKKKSTSVFDSDSDSNWSDWEGDIQTLTCLFCAQSDTDFGKLKTHMREEHRVDFDGETAGMTFYDRVKIVNFIRRKVHVLECTKCDEKFKTSGELQTHLKQQSHYFIGDRKQWDLPEYFFPTYEDDAFLCSLDENFDDDSYVSVAKREDDASAIVVSEDTNVSINLDAEALSKEQMLQF